MIIGLTVTILSLAGLIVVLYFVNKELKKMEDELWN